MNTPSKLDADELLHLAIKASDSDRREEAIEYLKRGLELSPDDANINYMLGAQYAEIGMYDRAAEAMEKAIAANPDLNTARFQLGLLHITSGRVEEAQRVWEPLDALGEQEPLFLFKRALLLLAEDRYDECIADIEAGISKNQINEPLNDDMRRIIAEIHARRGGAAPGQTAGPTTADNVFLSAYQTGDDNHDD